MHSHHVDLLHCPSCGTKMQLAAHHPDGSEIISGSLSCQARGVSVPGGGGVARFDSHGYAHNFSAQWKRFTDFAKYYAVDDETYYRKGLGLVPADVSGKKVLEVGCGNRSEEHTSELQSRFGISYAVF